MATTDIDQGIEQRGINVIRGLSMDAVQKANSGHPGTPMALAPLAHVLWTRVMKYDAAAPDWPDRDRFVLSNGHASMLLYSLLYLTGFGLTLDDLREFRQWGVEDRRAPRVPPRRGHRGHHRSARAGLRQRGRHRPGRGQPARPVRRGGRRPPHVRVLRRRRPRGGRQPRGGVDRRAPRARPPGLRLRRQPHHHRRPDRARPTATTCPSASRATAGTSCSWARSPTTSTRWRPGCGRAWPRPARPSLLVLRSHIGYPSPKYTDTAKAHGSPLGADEVARGQGDPRAPAGGLLLARRRRRVLPRRRHPRPRARARSGSGAGPRSATRSPTMAAQLDACHEQRGLAGWESELPVVEGGRGARHPPGVHGDRQRGARRRARAWSPAAPTSPGTPAWSSSDARDHRHPPVRRPPASTTASASTAWAR